MPTLRECLLTSIDQYDAATSIADRKEAAVVVVERVRMYLAAKDHMSARTSKRIGKVEDEDEDDNVFSNPDTSSKLHLHITGNWPFDYLGVTYPTVQHAFQAQKFADEEDRERIASLGRMEAITEGRHADIDVTEWDANKVKLMYHLLKTQAEQNEDMTTTLIQSRDVDIHVDDIYDDYWPKILPRMYAKLGKKLAVRFAAAHAPKSDDDDAPRKRKDVDSPTTCKAGKARKTK